MLAYIDFHKKEMGIYDSKPELCTSFYTFKVSILEILWVKKKSRCELTVDTDPSHCGKQDFKVNWWFSGRLGLMEEGGTFTTRSRMAEGHLVLWCLCVDGNAVFCIKIEL